MVEYKNRSLFATQTIFFLFNNTKKKTLAPSLASLYDKPIFILCSVFVVECLMVYCVSSRLSLLVHLFYTKADHLFGCIFFIGFCEFLRSL